MKWLLAILLGSCAPTVCAADPVIAPAVIPDTIIITSLGINEEIVNGWQIELDAGYVVRLGDPLCTADVRCRGHYAGHRTSHGSVFFGVDTLVAGDQFSISHMDSTYGFVVVGKELVVRVPTVLTHMMTLQTSSPDPGFVWLIYAERVG